MDNEKVSGNFFSIFEPAWCQEHILSASLLLDNKKKLTKSEILALKQDFETYFVQYRSFDNNSEEKVSKLQMAIRELNELAQSLDNIEQSESESEAKRSLIVCSSSLFKNESYKPESNWNSDNIVGLDFSFTKSYQISPDVRRGSNESDVSALSLVYKWKGLKSNVIPLNIPIQQKELPQFLQGAVVMFSIFDPTERGFPVCPIDPSSCKEVLKKVENWSKLGETILESFGLTAENIGNLLKKHLHDIAFSSQEIEHEMEGTKSMKKKIAEEHMADIWSKRKRAFLKNIEKKSD